MRRNEYNSIEQFTSQYTGIWNPSGGNWFGLDFEYSGIEYRFHTGSMYKADSIFPDGREILFSLYRKKTYIESGEKEYELIGEYANMSEALESKAINGKKFKDVIMDDDTELVGQD